MRFILSAALFLSLPAFADTTPPAPPPAGAPIGDQILHAFMQVVVPALITALAALLAWALKKLGTFLHTKAEGNAFGTAGVKVYDYLSNATQHLIAGMAPEFRKALANDGKIDEAERAALKAKLMELVKAEMPEGVMSVLGNAFGSGLETVMSGLTEKVLAEAEKKAVASPQ
jgi:hypothetical protein